MKYSYNVPASSYTRTSQYTTTHYTPTQYTSSNYRPTQYTSTYTPSKYTSTTYSPPHYTPSHYTPTYRSTSTYTPSYSKETRPSSTRRAPVPEKRTVHFPNEIIFQDIVRKADMEQIGRFMRARKVRVDAVFPSGLAAIHEGVLTGNLEVVKLLVRYGADVHQRDEDGWTPLHMACSDGYPEIAKYLLSIGASTEAMNENGDKPADLIDPDITELTKLFETGCV